MSWHVSRALVEASSAASCSGSDGEPSALSKTIPMPETFSWLGRTVDASKRSRSGVMSAPLTDDLGRTVLTWCLAASRARTSRAPVKAQASKETSRDSGRKWPASLAKYDPASSSWRTRQFSLLGDSEPFSETWPRWGSMRSGESWERMPDPSTLPIGANEFGSLLATPTANQLSPEMVRKWPGCAAIQDRAKYPTPTALASGKQSGRLDELGGSGNPYRRTNLGRRSLNPEWY